jgi:hypothetical protein
MLYVNHLRHYLEHSWSFHRHIIHHHTGQVANVNGTVLWNLASNLNPVSTLQYCETGLIHIGTYTGYAKQTYYYTFISDRLAEVYFSDNRFFYTLDLTTSHCDIQHPCGQDTYNGTVEAISQSRYRQIWRVTGPYKDYTSDTIFFR